ncbi:MAG: hypothetical protein HY558_02235 [Euryarchaeota archaeon]|nr:hypothetical protein [Euryarchaeota archaeon]
MGRSFPAILAILWVLILLPGPGGGQSYAFGTSQIHEKIDLAPGATFTTPIQFYNIYGDRTTHVALKGFECVDQTGYSPCPEGWRSWVSISPPIKPVSYRHPNTSELCTLDENFQVEPRPLVPKTSAEGTPPGWTYLPSPSKPDHWIPARAIEVTFSIPRDAPPGTYHFVASATGSWVPDKGCKDTAIAFSQMRNFKYDIRIGQPEGAEPSPPPKPLERLREKVVEKMENASVKPPERLRETAMEKKENTTRPLKVPPSLERLREGILERKAAMENRSRPPLEKAEKGGVRLGQRPGFDCAVSCGEEAAACLKEKGGLEACRPTAETCLQKCGARLPEKPVAACPRTCKEKYEQCKSTGLPEELCQARGLLCASQCSGFEQMGRAAVTMAMKAEQKVDPGKTVARDPEGKPIEVLARAMTIQKGPRGNVMRLPVALKAGQKMAEFKAEHMELQGNQMVMPLKSGDIEVAKIRARLGEMRPGAEGAEAPVEALELETQPVEADFTRDDPRVGRARVHLKAGLREMPPEARLEMQPTRAIEEKVRENYQRALQARRQTLKDVAYAVVVDTENLSIENSSLQMRVAREWVEAHGGPDAVRILRMPDNAQAAEVLDTLFRGYDPEGQALFEANATGLSVFSLAATETVTTTPSPPATAIPAPEPTRKTPGIEGGLAMAVLLALALLLRRRP